MTRATDEVSIRDWCAVVGVALGAFMAILDIQIINASLREIQGSLGLDFSEGGWISTVYLIAEIIVIPLTAFCAIAFGTRRYILFNTVVFILASAACGISWNLSSMLIFRALQGLSGGVLIPMSFQTMLTILPVSRRNTGLAIFGLTATLAPTLGPAVGGFLTEFFGWRSIFFLNILPGSIMIGLIYYGMKQTPILKEKLKEIDYVGALTLAIALGTFTYILEKGAESQWFEDSTIRVATLGCIVALSLFACTQLMREKPLLNLKLLLNRNFGISAVVTLLAAMALYGGVYATSIYLGQVQSYSASQIGGIMMWIGIPQLFVMPLLPWLMNRVDLRLLSLIGFVLFAYSNFLNSGLDYNYAGDQFRISMILRAVGQPLFMIPLSALGMAMIKEEDSGDGSAIYNMFRNLGGSMGIALVSTFLIGRTNLHFFSHTAGIDPDNTLVISPMIDLQHEFMLNRYPAADAQILTGKHLLETAYRESLIQSFGDVFLMICAGLIACACFVLLLKKTQVNSSHLTNH